MKKTSKQRSDEEAKTLQEAFHLIKFFVSVNDEISEDLILKLYKELKHEYFTRRSKIFKIGDLGNKFYIILKGSVYVLLEKTGFKEEVEEFSEDENHKFDHEEAKLIDNIFSTKQLEKAGPFANVNESDKENALIFLKKQIREFEKSYSRKNYSDKDNSNIIKAIKRLQNLDITSKNFNFISDKIRFPDDFLNILNDNDYASLMFPDLVQSKELKIGDSFGEVALRRSIPRFCIYK